MIKYLPWQVFLCPFDIIKGTCRQNGWNSNPIFKSQLVSILTLYRTAEQEVQSLENEIIPLIQELNPKTLTIPGIGYITATTIITE